MKAKDKDSRNANIKGNGKGKSGFDPGMIIMIVCGAVAGFYIGTFCDIYVPEDAGFGGALFYIALQVLLLVLCFFVQLIIHEGGHLAAGLLTGYRFSSFRIGSLMLVRNHEGFSFRRFSLAGTGGQCLMIPPAKRSDGTYPYRLYHLGGVLLNLITAVLSFVTYQRCMPGRIITDIYLYFAIAGFICAVTNGIPVRVSGVATDGYNVMHIADEPFALEALWLQLKINEAQTEGIRLRDLPEEWFEVPEDASRKNVLISAITVFSENRAMDMHDFEKAKKIIAELDNSDECDVIGIYRNLLLIDKTTIELLEKGRDADISAFNSRQSKAFRKSMSKFPAVIRAEYAASLLHEGDVSAAQKYKDIFDAVAQKYPLKSDIDSETEIMNYIDRCFDQAL